MGYSDKVKGGGGGAVEGEIVDYTFMDTFPFADDDADEKDSDNDNIYLLLVLRPDGVDDGDEENYTKRSLYLGSGKYLRIEEDGKTLVSTDDDGTPRLYDQGEVFKFVASLEEAGFPAEARFPDPEEEKVIDLRAMLGTRVRLANEVDEEATKKFGKRKVKKGKHKGKEFNRTYTKVTKVLEIPDEDGGKKSSKSKAKAGVKEAAKKADAKAKSKSKAKDEDDDDAEEDDDEEVTLTNKQADKLLLAVLNGKQGKNGAIPKGDLALAITRHYSATKGDMAERNVLRSLVVDEDWLEAAAERGTIEFDASSKKQMVTAA